MNQIRNKQFFESEEFISRFHCSHFLGSMSCPEWTIFSLWAPTAQTVTLRIFEKGSGGEPLETHRMKPGIRGRWSRMLTEDLEGYYYDYLVTVDGKELPTADPYGKACGVNGERSMIIDLARTDPEGWDMDRAPARKPETIIYELHVKDFTWQPESGVRPEWRGRFLGLTEEGTTLNGDGIHPTGLDYLKSLGITHVQLMPIYDYGSVDEAGSREQFNWGYDPMNYNIPEGSYATDPEDGAVRIRELKEAIQALHRSGLRVIMDVVYNHTYKQDSCLWRTVPGYFYRQNDDGTPANGSGCGNDLATERSMVGRYILDSVLYWAEEYHIDGFRFDLMGLLDVPLMNRIRLELDARYGRGEKILLGEPWAAASTNPIPGTLLAHKGNMNRLDTQIAAFCDATRDAVKGNLFEEKGLGFVNGGGMDSDRVLRCLQGWCDESLPRPSQVVTYLSCHDDWTLWDRLVCTGDPKKRFTLPQKKLLRENRLAAAICYCCQGELFLLSGEEFGRTKKGCRNSFNAPLDINALDWNLAWTNQGLADYYRGLMALRMQLPGLQDKSRHARKRFTKLPDPEKDCALISVNNTGGESPWTRLLVVFSAHEKPVSLLLPDGEWEVLVNADTSFAWKNPVTVTGQAILEPVSAMVFGQRDARKEKTGR